MITSKIFIRSKAFAPLLIFILVLLLFSSAKVLAQNTASGLDLTVSPPVFDLTAKPGDKIRETFRVRNNGTTPRDLQVSARRLISDPTNGAPVPESDTKGEEISWVSFDPSSLTALPREWVSVTFTINIPKNAAYGYYYVFSIAPKDTQTQKTTGANVKGELLVVILLNVKSEGSVSKAELVNFSPKNFVTEYLPVTFETEVVNRGNIHVKPHGNIFITRQGSKEIGTLDVNAGIGSILPGGKRTFESSWTDGFLVNEPVMEDGQPKLGQDGKPEMHLAINWNSLTHFRVGPYTARLLLVYDDGTRDQTIEATANFWVMPYMALAVITISLIIILFLVRALLRSYVRSQVKKSSGR